MHQRIQWDPLECAFAQEWEKENERNSRPSLLELLLDGDGQKVSGRDRYVAATVVQWLGTNVGFSFLVTCLKAGGYSLVRNYVDGVPVGILTEVEDAMNVALRQAVEEKLAEQANFDYSEPH